MNITSKDYLGRVCVLTKDGQPVAKGSTHNSFRGEPATIDGGTAPHKASSTGFVSTSRGEYGPTVFGMKWEVQP